MNRDAMLRRAADRTAPWDVVVIGGGATGAGVAVDAAARGYSVLLLERGDFGCGTSSRSTKLVHGGVRYLRQGNVSLVFEALHERTRLLRNAPHVVHDLSFLVPCYRRRDVLTYGVGLKAYDLLAGRNPFGHAVVVSAAEAARRLPTVRTDGLRGGVVYHDGQFDDSRLLIHLLMTAADLGACVVNYAAATGLTRDASGTISGVRVRDAEGGAEFVAAAKVVVNAAGPFCDEVRQMASPAATPMLAASQGSHVVLDRAFLPGGCALLIPETSDGRVLFAIPWHGHTLVGTTDVALPAAPVDPHASDAEIDFILETAGRYLTRKPTRGDVLGTFAGIRPLVKSGGNTAAMSRDHAMHVDAPGLVTITGGKWTTYRSMAEGCVDKAAAVARLPSRPCRTADLQLHGYAPPNPTDPLAIYGTDAAAIRQLATAEPSLTAPLHPALPYCGAEVVWAVRSEMARTVLDVLTRRTRALYLNTKAAIETAPRVAELMARELGRGAVWVAEQVRAVKNQLPGEPRQ